VVDIAKPSHINAYECRDDEVNSTMTIPGFAAEASLHRMVTPYRAALRTQQAGDTVFPAQDAVPQWCGDKFIGQVSQCPGASSCRPIRSRVCEGWWIFRSCTYMQSVDWYCQ
jgi:hypothetical protein